MIKGKFLWLFILGILILGSFFVLGEITYSKISLDYDFYNNKTPPQTVTYYTDAILLSVSTDDQMNCSYSTDKSFSSTITQMDNDIGLLHESLISLEEGFYKYYIQCEKYNGTKGAINEVSFTVSNEVANIEFLDGTPPLKEGTYNLKLTMAQPVSKVPELQYSLDGNVWKKIPLIGSGEIWLGNFIVTDSMGNAVGSFQIDGEGIITGDSVFIVDTIKPETIEVIDSTGYEGKIVVNWYYEDEAAEFRVYYSENSNIDKTDSYRIVHNYDSDYEYSYTDTSVEKGKTYYYKIAAVDEAGNVGELSPETYSTALISEASNTSSGLDLKLVGKVDNFVTEIVSVIEDVEFVKAAQRDEKESEIFEKMKLNKEIDSSLSELENLKSSVEKYKLQDLSENELEKKINSASLKLDVIRKKIPESITITDEENIKGSLDEETLQKALLEYKENNLDESTDKNIKAILDLMKEKGLEISRTFYSLQITYLDGTRKDVTLVKENLDSEMERDPSVKFVLAIPKNIAEDISEVMIMNLDYEVIKSDPVISFSSDSKEIVYYFEKELSLSSLEDTIIAPVKEIDSTTKITGNFIGNISTGGSIGIIILFVVFLGLVFYFVYLKKSPGPRNVLIVLEKVKKVKELKDEGKNNEAMELYGMVKEEYKKLSDKDRNLALQEIQKIGLK